MWIRRLLDRGWWRPSAGHWPWHGWPEWSSKLTYRTPQDPSRAGRNAFCFKVGKLHLRMVFHFVTSRIKMPSKEEVIRLRSSLFKCQNRRSPRSLLLFLICHFLSRKNHDEVECVNKLRAINLRVWRIIISQRTFIFSNILRKNVESVFCWSVVLQWRPALMLVCLYLDGMWHMCERSIRQIKVTMTSLKTNYGIATL